MDRPTVGRAVRGGLARTVVSRAALDRSGRERSAPTAGGGAVRGELSIRAIAAGGRTQLTGLRSAFPLALRRTGPHRAHLVGTGAWPLGGDTVRLDVEVGAHAQLDLATVAAAVALPGRSAVASRFEVGARVAEGGSLSLDLGTTILAAGCDHLARVDVRLADGARFAHRELLVRGREGEPGGNAQVHLHVVGPDGPIVRDRLVSAPPTGSSLVDGGARACGSVLAVGDQPSPAHRAGSERTGPVRAGTAAMPSSAMRADLFDLPVAGWRAVALGDDVATIDAWLAHAWSAAVPG